MELYARPLHRYPIAQLHSSNRITVVSAAQKTEGPRFMNRLVIPLAESKVKGLLLHSLNRDLSNSRFLKDQVQTGSVNLCETVQGEKDFTSSTPKIINWEFPNENETLYGAFPWTITIGTLFPKKSMTISKLMLSTNQTKHPVEVVSGAFSHLRFSVNNEDISSLPLIMWKVEYPLEFLPSAELELEMNVSVDLFFARPKLSYLQGLSLFSEKKVSSALLIPAKGATSISLLNQRKGTYNASYFNLLSSFMNYLFLHVHCNLNFEHLIDPLSGSFDDSVPYADTFIPKLSDYRWNSKLIRRLAKGLQIVTKSTFQDRQAYVNVLFPSSTYGRKLIRLSHEHQRKGPRRHLWCRFSFRKFDVRSQSSLHPLVYVPQKNFEQTYFTGPTPASTKRVIESILVQLTFNIHPNIAEMKPSVGVAMKHSPVNPISNETEKVQQIQREEQQLAIRNDQTSPAQEKSVAKQVEHYISKSASSVLTKAEKERKRWSVLVSESFYEAFPSVVTDLLIKHSIHSIDYNIGYDGIVAILDPAVGVFLIAEEEILDRERFRTKLKDIIKASFQFYRLWILILQRSIARAFSNERVILLVQSVAKLPCKVCVRTCPYNDYSISKILTSFCLQTYKLADEMFLKPETYYRRDFLLKKENPQIAAQIFVLQKFPMINAFLAASLLQMRFIDIFSVDSHQLRLVVSKTSIHPEEVEKVLELFHEAVNQYL